MFIYSSICNKVARHIKNIYKGYKGIAFVKYFYQTRNPNVYAFVFDAGGKSVKIFLPKDEAVVLSRYIEKLQVSEETALMIERRGK